MDGRGPATAHISGLRAATSHSLETMFRRGFAIYASACGHVGIRNSESYGVQVRSPVISLGLIVLYHCCCPFQMIVGEPWQKARGKQVGTVHKHLFNVLSH